MKKIIRKLLDKISYSIFSKKTTLIGRGQKFYRTAKISLIHGSTKKDIVIKANARIHGRLLSTDGGKIEIGEYAHFGPNSTIACLNSVFIGAYTGIGSNVKIVDNNYHSVNPVDRKIMRQSEEGSDLRRWKYSDNKPIVIGENVWVGENVRILKGVNIGDNSVVAASTVVTKDVPPNSIVAGNPGKIVKTDIDKLPRFIHD